MTAVLNVARFDLAIVRVYLKHLLAFLVIMAMLTIINGSLMAVPFFVFFGSILASYPFSIGERDRADLLLASMPVRRHSIVFGRYLFAALDFVVVLAAGLAVTYLVQGARSLPPVSGEELAVVVLASFVLYGLIIAVQYPLYFLLGYTKARLASLLPVIAIGATAGAAFASHSVDELAAVLAALATPLGAVGLVVGTIVLVLGSAAFTSRRYARKDV